MFLGFLLFVRSEEGNKEVVFFLLATYTRDLLVIAAVANPCKIVTCYTFCSCRAIVNGRGGCSLLELKGVNMKHHFLILVR